MNQIGLLDSGVIRGLLVALGSLLGLVVTKLGFTFDDVFYAKLTDAVLMLLIAGSTLYAAWMRARKANPPITDAAIAHTQERVVQEKLEREGGFARPAALALLAGVTLLGACSVLGLQSADTFGKKLTVGYSTITELRNTATQLLELRVIRAEDAQNVQDLANSARTGLDLARALQATDQKAADAKLRQAQVVLESLRAYLRSRAP